MDGRAMIMKESNQWPGKELLRLTACGSVDDGKSTLIGRLLYDSGNVPDDQLEAVIAASRKKGKHHIDFSLFTDGLQQEREAGITIDVAYRYFETAKRKYILDRKSTRLNSSHT